MKNRAFILLIITLSSCTMIKYRDFEELYKNKGTENYEVIEIIPKQNQASYFQLDTVTKKIFVNSFFEPRSKRSEDMEYDRLRIDILGNIKDKGATDYILKDGTMWDSNYYLNWVISGDTSKHNYIDPFSNKEIDNVYEFEAKEKDPEKWLGKFKELYTKAQYVYEDSFYYFKIDDKWYLMDIYQKNLKGLPEYIGKHYLAKEDLNVRMVTLPDITPDFYGKTNLEDEIFMRSVGYKEEDHESGRGLNPIDGTAGYHYIELYMPFGDVIKIKRFGTMGENIETYKIPPQYGGRNDVVFIEQEANLEMYPGREYGGMYAIRPRDPEQPQRRYKSIVYNKNKNGERVIDLEQSEETEAYKAWVKKKK